MYLIVAKEESVPSYYIRKPVCNVAFKGAATVHDFVFGVQLTKYDPMDDYNLVEFNHISCLRVQNSLIFSGLYLTKPVTVLTTKLFLDQRQNLAKKGITASAL